MTTVRIVKDWHSPDLMQQTPQKSQQWGDVQFTFDELDACDYLVCLNPPPMELKVQAKAAWLFTQEPPVPYYKWHKPAFKHFDKVYTQHPNDENLPQLLQEHGCLPWHVGKTFDELYNLPKGEKIDKVSTITSNAYERPGHKARYDLIQYLLKEEYDLELFGRGIRFIEDKFDGLYPFKYSIAIENSFYEHYWTEKISDCFLAWNMPIYAGCPNITDYFPAESMILIDPFDLKAAKEKIEQAVREDWWTKNIDALAEARKRALEQYQFFPWIAQKVKEAEQGNLAPKAIHIPKFKRPFNLKNKLKQVKKMFK